MKCKFLAIVVVVVGSAVGAGRLVADERAEHRIESKIDTLLSRFDDLHRRVERLERDAARNSEPRWQGDPHRESHEHPAEHSVLQTHPHPVQHAHTSCDKCGGCGGCSCGCCSSCHCYPLGVTGLSARRSSGHIVLTVHGNFPACATLTLRPCLGKPGHYYLKWCPANGAPCPNSFECQGYNGYFCSDCRAYICVITKGGTAHKVALH